VGGGRCALILNCTPFPCEQEYEAVVGGRKHDFRSGGGKVTERVRVSPDTLDFKDVDESLWDKGAQTR
jgi:hypothetical protein